ncbi:MAG: prepilin-type N-terminal cleavage/methylation domain-containing protein [Deltaproteobacteria bacterium]|nr:prepilin-type N-terminal cleavage/methylation domain-containing protein [Deltaproteobacteria bacterium]
MSRGHRQRGFTLIELLVVMVIIGIAVGVIILGVGATAQAKLRSSAWTLTAASRYAYSRAVTHGTTTRVVLDFEARTIHIEETTGRVVLNADDETGSGMRRGDDEEYLGDAGVENESLSTRIESIGQSIGLVGSGLGSTSGSGTADGADPFGGMMTDVSRGSFSDPFLASLQGTGGSRPSRYRGARFQPLSGRRGEKRELEGNTVFLKAFTPHEPTVREDGKAFIYFFPGGTTEHAVVQLSDGNEDDERIYTVEVHPLNGRAVIHRFEYEPEMELDELQEAEE